MESESRQAHWENVYTKKGENEVSWFQENPAQSLDLIAEVGATVDTAIIDIGGGASRVVDCLVEKGFRAGAVLDLLPAALKKGPTPLGGRGAKVSLVGAEATTWQPP